MNTLNHPFKKAAYIGLAILMSLFLFQSNQASAQRNLTLYGMKSLPQRNFANPALRPDSRLFVGIPGISSLYAGFGNSSLQLPNLFNALERHNDDSVTLNVNELGSVFRKKNSFSNEVNIDLLHFGFELGDNNFFTVNATYVHRFKLSFSNDLFDLVFQGNGGDNLGRRFNMGVGIDLMEYTEIGLGYSRRFLNDRLTLGARYKYLKGVLNFNTERSDLTFTTRPGDYALLLDSDIKVNMASSIGPVTGNWPTYLKNLTPFDLIDMATKNSGWGLDFGATYDLTKRVELSAAVKNLGRIKWNDNALNWESRNPGAQFEFNGIDFNTIFDNSSTSEEAIEALSDSLIDRFAVDSSNKTYTTGLFPEFYLGGTLSLTKNHRAGVLFYGDWFQKQLHPAITLSWYSQLSRVFSISASYTLMDNTFNNLGVGMAFNGGPFQYYIVTDNLISVVNPDNVRNFSVRMGFNLTFLRKPKEKKEYEKKKK